MPEQSRFTYMSMIDAPATGILMNLSVIQELRSRALDARFAPRRALLPLRPDYSMSHSQAPRVYSEITTQVIPGAAECPTKPGCNGYRRDVTAGFNELHVPDRDVRFFRKSLLCQASCNAQTTQTAAEMLLRLGHLRDCPRFQPFDPEVCFVFFLD